jgi:arylsulfatase A-like enzyme
MKKFRCCNELLAALVALALCVPAADLAAAAQPNIILVVADDLGYGDVSFQGSTQIQTPHLDALARSGVQFKQGYVSAPVCSPSRAGLLTGRNQVRFGYDNNLDESTPGFDPEFAGLNVKEQTIADRLQAAGYTTGIVGKWHLGARPQFHPLQRGFMEFWGFLGGGHDYFPTTQNNQPERKIECNFKAAQPITYLTDDLGSEAVDFIERHRERRFFLYLAFNAPHSPMQATEDDLEKFASIKDLKRRTYCAMVHRLDVNVGRVVAALAQAGLTTNTLIAFISDNGGPVDQNASMNAPLNGQKGILLEGGLRVPFIMSWPGTLPAGRQYDHPVSSLDLTPTFLAAAGNPAPESADLDGVNLLPHLMGKSAAPPHESLLWRFTISAAIRAGDWKLIRLPDRLPMLFNLKSDLSEQHDVALDNLERTRDMLRQLGQWDVRLPHPLFLEGAVWKSRQLNLYDATYPIEQPRGGETPRMITRGPVH